MPYNPKTDPVQVGAKIFLVLLVLLGIWSVWDTYRSMYQVVSQPTGDRRD